MAIREGRWDCLYCEARAIRGRHLVCPHCNRTRPEGIRFYLPENAEQITEEFLIERANTGPDWICPFCESSNPNNANKCQRCMAPRGEEVTAQSIRRYSLDEVAREGDLAAQERAAYGPPPEEASEPEPEPAPAPKGRTPRTMFILGGILFLLLCLCGSIAFFTLRSSDTTATVVDVQWQRTVQIEVYETIVEEGFDLPAGGRILEQREEINGYENVQIGTEFVDREVSEQVQVGEREYVCGQEDLGNGFFQDVYCTEPVFETQYRTETVEEPIYEEQPIYDTYYVYELDVWNPIRTESASGADSNSFWPQTNLAEGEREGARTESYLAIFQTSDGQTYELELPPDEWGLYDIGDEVTLEINGFGDVTGVRQ